MLGAFARCSGGSQLVASGVLSNPFYLTRYSSPTSCDGDQFCCPGSNELPTHRSCQLNRWWWVYGSVGISLELVGCSSETWNTGWCTTELGTDQVRRCGMTPSLRSGRGQGSNDPASSRMGGLDVPRVQPDSVPDFEWMDWEVSRRGVDLVLFEGM